jgi:hypothetical protein
LNLLDSGVRRNDEFLGVLTFYEFIIIESTIFKKSSPPSFPKRSIILPLPKGGEEGFYRASFTILRLLITMAKSSEG